MARGRKPTPTAILAARGSPEAGRRGAWEPTPAGGTPKCPRTLDAIGRREWRRLSAELAGMGVLAKCDQAALAALCDSISVWVRATATVNAEGLTIVTPKGFRMPHPAVGIARNAADRIVKYSTEFGLTPAARPKIHAAPKTEGELEKPNLRAFIADGVRMKRAVGSELTGRDLGEYND